MQQTAQANDPNALVLDETMIAATQHEAKQLERFVVVVSGQFSGLLLARQLSMSGVAALHPTAMHEESGTAAITSYQTELTFDPEVIAAFLAQLSLQPDADVIKSSALDVVKQHRQPNDSRIQSEFTLHLAEILTAMQPPSRTADSCDMVVAAALQQQVEQERSLNQVTAQIRQSIDLPAMLETAVQQVQQSLQVDRAVIYEFSQAAIVPRLDAGPETVTLSPHLAHPNDLAYGGITYEALASDRIPSVLYVSEGMYCFPNLPNRHIKYHKGSVVAIDDVATAYERSPCLLKLMQQAHVRAKLIVPIIIEDELWGLLMAHQCTVPRQWQEREQTFLKRIAEHLAIGIYQARLYAQLQQQKQMLEQHVAERTQELHDALLVAQTANRTKTDFLAAMSHELRTPLTCVIGMAETLLRTMTMKPDTHTLQPHKQREYLEIIKRSGEHLLELINDILDVSQVEAGKTVLNIKPFAVSQIAHQSLQMLRERAYIKKVDLRMEPLLSPSDANPTDLDRDSFLADARRVSQILLNLLSNAIKFTPEGGHVTLRFGKNHDTAIFQVEDTGIGIPENQQHLLFQKFQQLDSSLHRTYEGTGLGLALTKQLVELHGGKIEVRSTVGVGSTFTVWLPTQAIAHAASKPASSERSIVPPSDLLPADVTGTHSLPIRGQVVLIEDHEETAMLICDLLTVAGCQVVWMIDGSTALKQIEMLQPSLVITDIQLPGMDGYEIMHFLRKHPTLQKTKILALTAKVTPEDQERCLDVGADEYLAKPVQPYQLLDKVVALVGESEE